MIKSKLLYVGNKLSFKNRNQTIIEQLSTDLRKLNYKIESYSSEKNKIKRLFSMLWAIFKHRNSDYLLIDTYSTSAFWYAWLCGQLAKVLGLKYILILHGGNLPIRLEKNPKLCQSLFSKAYMNIAPSNYLYHTFKSKGFKNLKLIPNTIEIKNYNFQERSNLKPNLLWVRAFAEIYNPLLALRVLKQLLNDYPEAKLSMVGPFKDKSIVTCKAYAKKHNLPVKFTGKMKKKVWIDYAKNFDVFINTTNVDNTPISVIEAMALGLPVVTTNVGGLPYLLEDHKQALLVNPNNKNEMYSAIKDLINNNELSSTLSKNGRVLAESFGWETVKHKWKEILK